MIAAYQGISAMSRAIRFLNWSKYSHISWVDPDGSETEAWTHGIRRLETAHTDHAPNTVVDLFDVELTQGELDGLRRFLAEQEGKGYDFRGVLHFVSRRPERAGDQERWFCSEVVFAGFAHIRKPLLLRVPAYKVYPGMLVYSPRLVHVRTIRLHDTNPGNDRPQILWRAQTRENALTVRGVSGGPAQGENTRMQSAKDQLQRRQKMGLPPTLTSER